MCRYWRCALNFPWRADRCCATCGTNISIDDSRFLRATFCPVCEMIQSCWSVSSGCFSTEKWRINYAIPAVTIRWVTHGQVASKSRLCEAPHPRRSSPRTRGGPHSQLTIMLLYLSLIGRCFDSMPSCIGSGRLLRTCFRCLATTANFDATGTTYINTVWDLTSHGEN